jgi:hypothetical protein
MSPQIKDEYKVLKDYLPLGYEYEFEWYIDESNDMTIEIYLLYEEDIVDYFYCEPHTLQETIQSLIETANSDYRDRKISNILNG